MHLPNPVTPFHIGHAVIRLREIERTPHNGGRRGAELVRERIAQKAHIEELLDAFEREAAQGREIDGGSMPQRDVAPAAHNCNRNATGTRR